MIFPMLTFARIVKGILDCYGMDSIIEMPLLIIIFSIPICRLKCPSCGKTVSIIPSFLLPYFQHTVATILIKLKNYFLYRKVMGYRQLLEFFSRRFRKNLTRIEMFFRDTGFRGVFPFNPKEKAIKLVEMLLALGKAPLLRRGIGHFPLNFMAS